MRGHNFGMRNEEGIRNEGELDKGGGIGVERRHHIDDEFGDRRSGGGQWTRGIDDSGSSGYGSGSDFDDSRRVCVGVFAD